jgi:predicted chitinase
MNMGLGYTRLIVDECKRHGLLRNQAANVLAQINWETGGTMKPVRETFAPSDSVAKARLTKAWKAGQLSWVKRDYWSGGFFGRGFLQITHEENYRKAGNAVGVDLVKDPTLALDPVISAKIAVMGMKEGWFTRKRLSDYITLSRSDYIGARAIVNGDKAKRPKGSKETIGQIIAARSRSYDAALKAEGYGEKTTPDPKPVQPPKPLPSEPVHRDPPKPPSALPDNRNRILAGIAAAFLALSAYVATKGCEWFGIFCGG